MITTYTQDDIDTISEIYDAAVNPARWNDNLEKISRRARTDGIVLFAEDPLNSGLSILAFNSLYSEDFILHYLENVQPLEAHRFQELVNLPAREIHLDSEFQTIEEADAMPGLRHIRKHLGVTFRAVTHLHDKGVWFDAFTCQYKIERSEFTDWHRGKINAFLPHVGKVIELSRPFSVLRKRFHAVLAALDFLRLGVFVLEERGGSVVSNAEAQRILDLDDGISMDNRSRLRVADTDTNEKLSRAIQRAVATALGEDDHAETLLSVRRYSDTDPFLLEVCPIRDNRTEFDEDFRGALVLVIDLKNGGRISTEGMAHLYDLTPAETEICRLVVQGSRSDEIADKRNVSLETVRSQIKKLLEKTGTHQRSELVRLAMTVNLPIDDPTQVGSS